MPPRLVPVDYDPFAESHVSFTPVDYDPFDVAAAAARMRAAGTAPPVDPRDAAAERRRQDRNRGVGPAPERTPEDARRLNRIGAGQEQVGDREALAAEQQAPNQRSEFQSNFDASHDDSAPPEVRDTMAYIGTRLHQLNPQQYPWLYRNGHPLTSQEIGELVMRKSDEITGMSPQDATNYLFGRPEMRPANVAGSLGQRRAPPSVQDPLLMHQTPGPDGNYEERTGPNDYSGTEFPTSPEPVADTWSQRAHKFLSRTGDLFSQSFNGLLMREAERQDGATSYTAAGDQAFDSSGNELYHTVQSEGQRLVVESQQALNTPGRRAFEAAQADLNHNAYNYSNGADSYLTQTAESLVQMLPVIAAGIVTRGRSLEGEAEAAPGTLLGRIVHGFGNEVSENRGSLGTLYEQQAGQQYGQSRAAGRSPDAANIDATVFGLAEAIPEALPMGSLMQPGGRFLPRLLRTSGFEGASEMMTQIVEDLYSKAVITPDMTWGQVRDDVLNAGALGAGLGAGMHVAEAPFHRQGAHGEIPTPTSPPGFAPGIREAAAAVPPNITPEDQASPLPTELIAQGKKAVADALATTQADQIVGDNIGHGIGDHVAVTIGGQTRTGQIHDAFTEEDPETGTHHGAVIGWHDGTTTRERFSDLADAGARVTRQAGAPDDIVMAHIGHAENAAGDARRNPRSTASGPFQFLDSTFRHYYQQVYGNDPGEHPESSVKNDPAVQRRLMVAMLADTRAGLQRAGQEATAGNLYLGHFLGQGGAVTVLRNPNAPIESLVDPRVMRANPFLRGMTGGDVAAWAARRMGGHLSPEQMAAGAEPETDAGPQPDFSWIDQPVDQAGAPTPEAAATTATAATEGDRGPAIGAPSSTGLGEVGAGIAGGISGGLHDMLFDRFQRGETTENGAPSAVLQVLAKIRDNGGTVTRESLPSIAADVARAPEKGPERQTALQGVVDSYSQPTGDGTRSAPITATTAEHVDQAAANAVQPTEAQAEAGNYQKGHVRVQGLDISIETPRGAERTGVGPDGERWSVTMPDHYGYVKRTTGADAEQMDVYVGPQPESQRVFVVDQNDAETGKFDEHKAMLGYADEAAAREAYHAAFSDGKGPDRVGAITEMSVPQFKEWLGSEQTAPAAETGGNASEGQLQSVNDASFDPTPHVQAMRDYVANSTGSLNDTEKMGKALGLTSEQTHRVMGALAAQPDSGIRMTKGRPAGTRRILLAAAQTVNGKKRAARYRTVTYRPAVPARFQRVPVRTAPLHFMEWVRAQGGVKSDRHDLRNVGALSRHPGVINNKTGLSLDDIGGRMVESGWAHERPTESDVLEMLTMGSNAKVYRPEDSHAITKGKQGDAEAQQRDAVASLAQEIGLTIGEDDTDAVMRYIGEGQSIDAALESAMRDASAIILEEAATASKDDFYSTVAGELYEGEHPEERGQGADQGDAGHAPAEEPSRPSEGAGQERAGDGAAQTEVAAPATDLLGAKINTPSEHDAALKEARKEYRNHPVAQTHFVRGWMAERGDEEAKAALVGSDAERSGAAAARGVPVQQIEQTDMFGTRPGDERAALERKGEGRKQSDATQKAPGSDGGLFDTNAKQGDIETAASDAGIAASHEQGAAAFASGRGRAAPSFMFDPAHKSAFLAGWDEAKTKAEPENMTQPESNPVEQAKAVLQNALDVLNGKPATKIEDAGEKIGGARKDRWAERGMNVGDLEDMSQGEAFQLVTKDAVWPKPDYGAMVESGVAPDAAAGVKLLRDSLAAKPRTDSDQGRRDYIEMMGAAREILGAVRTVEDLRGVQQQLYDRAGDTGRGLSRTPEHKAASAKLFSIFKGRRASFSLDGTMLRKAREMVAQDFPAKAEPWRRRYDVTEARGMWEVRPKGRYRAIESFATKTEAEAEAKRLYDEQDRTKPKQPDRPHLDRIERTGADVRGDRNIDSSDFLKDFGFRGIEYGNWVASDERQTSTNLAYEALHDLATTLDIPPRALSLGGQLGLAFGARGSGRAAAHYEPGKLVINLTKLSGAGTLAHEWGHALDHYFGTLDTDLGTRGAPKGASGWRSRTASRLVALGNLRPEMAQAFDRLMTTLFQREKSRADTVRGLELQIENTQAGIARQQEAMVKARAALREAGVTKDSTFVKQSEKWIAERERHLKFLGEMLAKATDETQPLRAAKVESSFYREAKALSGKQGESGYWARPTEMLARSFEAYVFDKIKAGGNVSQYLVQGVEENRYPPELYAGNPYPTGAEREAINAAYDHLFETMGVRDQPSLAGEAADPVLYQRRLNEGDDPVFYSALDRAVSSSTTARASAEQWAATLSKAAGVKKEELEWSGVFDWLDMQKGPVSRDDLLGVIRDGGIKVEEVVLGGPLPPLDKTEIADEADIRFHAELQSRIDEAERYGNVADEEAIHNSINYGAIYDGVEREMQRDQEDQALGTRFEQWSSDPRNKSYHELLITLPVAQGGNPERAPATHWEDDAVVAHARFMDKADAAGKRVLFVEEIQSDWHQKGRDEGYEQPATPEQKERVEDARHAVVGAEAALQLGIEAQTAAAQRLTKLAGPVVLEGYRLMEAEIRDGARGESFGPQEMDAVMGSIRRSSGAGFFGGRPADDNSYVGYHDAAGWLAQAESTFKRHGKTLPAEVSAALEEAERAHQDRVKMSDDLALRQREYDIARQGLEAGIPQAPFKSSWPALVMKRLIRWAVDHGYDRVAWTTGDEQNERYNLEKHIGRVLFEDNSSGGIGRANMDGPTTRGNLRVLSPDNHVIYDRNVDLESNPTAISDVIGHELADRLLAAAPTESRSAGLGMRRRLLENVDLKTGGEGMRGFYDRNLVNIANDLIKKHGGKVGTVPLENAASLELRQREAELLATQEGRTQRGMIGGKTKADRIAEIERRIEWLRARVERDANPGFDITPALADAARSGFPLFQRAQSSPVTEARAVKIAERLHAELDRLGISDRIALKAANGLLTGKGAQGAYFRRVIRVSLDMALDPMATLNHESIHAMRALGLFTTSEWSALKNQALADAGIKEFLRKGGYATLSDEARAEEAVAEFYARWRSERMQAKGFTAKAFQRLLDFVHALGRAVAWVKGQAPGAGVALRNIERGRIGERETGAGLDGAPRADLAPAMQEGDDGFNFDAPAPKEGMTERQRAELDARLKQSKIGRLGQQGIGDIAGGLFDSERDQGMLFQQRPTASEWSDRLNRIRDATGALKTITQRDKIALATDRLRINFQDRMLPLLRTQTAIEQVIGRELTDEEQPYRQEALYTGRVGHQFEKLTDDIVEPLFEAMQENGVNVDELESYLYARHAPERNAKLAKEGVQDGSGMSDIEAAAILARIDKAGKTDALKNVATWFDKLIAFSTDTRVAGDLMPQEQADSWRSVFPNYAPLRGHLEMPEEERPDGGQSGFSVRGPESKRAFGRKSLAADILAHAIVQAQEAVVRSEKNRVATELYNLVKANPDPTFWQTHKVVMKKRLNKETGLVESYAVTQTTAEDMPYTVNLKIGGKARRVTFNRMNPAAKRAAEAMRRLNEPELNVQILQRLNQWLSKANTTLSPDFIWRNALRDLETATANLSEFGMKGLRRDVIASYPKALAAAERGAFKREGDSEWDQAWKDYSAHGGRIAFNQIETVEDLQKQITKRFERIQASKLTPKEAGLRAWEGLKWVFGKIEQANQGVENATRLSVYKNLVDRGVSKKQAAFVAKEITVNFNRRGVYGVLMNSFYLFANASMQGNARMILALRHRKVQKIAGSMVVAGALLAMFNAAMGGDDDDGVPFYDKISDFEKQSNLIFMIPGSGGRYFKIPMAYGYNIFPDLGRELVDVFRGHTNPLDAAGSWFGNALNSFNPLGGNESIANFIAPTIVDPIIDLYVDNRDFSGRPIMPDQPAFGPPVPDSQRFWPSVPAPYHWLTDQLNRATGGDQIVPGWIDVSPETLDYMTQQALGSAGATVERLVSAGAKAWNHDPDNPLTLNDIPVVRTMVGQKPSWYDKAAFYARLNHIEETVQRAREYRRNLDRDGQRAYVAANRDVVELHRVATAAQREMHEIRKTRTHADILLQQGRMTQARYNEIKARMHAREERLFARFNAIYVAHVREPLSIDR